jgi:hypothetical protein
MYMLNVLAPPAASVPPTTVKSTKEISGIPPVARIIEGTVVINNSSIIRGLVSMTKAESVATAPPPLVLMVVMSCSIERHDTAPKAV